MWEETSHLHEDVGQLGKEEGHLAHIHIHICSFTTEGLGR